MKQPKWLAGPFRSNISTKIVILLFSRSKIVILLLKPKHEIPHYWLKSLEMSHRKSRENSRELGSVRSTFIDRTDTPRRTRSALTLKAKSSACFIVHSPNCRCTPSLRIPNIAQILRYQGISFILWDEHKRWALCNPYPIKMAQRFTGECEFIANGRCSESV